MDLRRNEGPHDGTPREVAATAVPDNLNRVVDVVGRGPQQPRENPEVRDHAIVPQDRAIVIRIAADDRPAHPDDLAGVVDAMRLAEIAAEASEVCDRAVLPEDGMGRTRPVEARPDDFASGVDIVCRRPAVTG